MSNLAEQLLSRIQPYYPLCLYKPKHRPNATPYPRKNQTAVLQAQWLFPSVSYVIPAIDISDRKARVKEADNEGISIPFSRAY